MSHILQRAQLMILLEQHDGDFYSAYATLVEQYGDGVVSEERAWAWYGQVDPQELSDGARRQLQKYVNTGELPSSQLELARPSTGEEKKALWDNLEAGALRLVTQVLNNDAQDKFDGPTRARVAMKVIEQSGTAERLRAGGSAPQDAHRAVPQLATDFGVLPDRQVLTMYVSSGLSVEALTNLLRTLDPTRLALLNPEYTRARLTAWQKNGVVMGEDGTVMAWDDAIASLYEELRILPSRPT